MACFQRRRGGGVVALGVHPHERQHAQADAPPVDLGAVAGDVALGLEPPDPAPGRSGGQPDARRQLGVGQPRVALQLRQDGDVVAIESRASGRLVTVHRRGGCWWFP
jgi:hypothetical protein